LILQFGEETAAQGSLILLRSLANYEILVDRLNWGLSGFSGCFAGPWSSRVPSIRMQIWEIEPNPNAPT